MAAWSGSGRTPTDKVFSTNQAYVGQPEAREDLAGAAHDGHASILSEPTELSELCYKVSESVTSDDGSAGLNQTTELPDRTMLQAFMDLNKLWNTSSYYVAHQAQQECGGDEEQLRTLVKELQRGAA